MARRTKSGFEQIAAMPWWVGILVGLIGYIAIRHGIGWYFASFDNPVLHGLGHAVASGAYAPLAWVLLVGCWLAALASFIGRNRRRQLLDNQTGTDTLRQMSWRQFEQLTGEAFRRQGYAVEETGLGGADGGIDLILRRNGQTTLVQCKQWKNRQVGVTTVREMYGLLVHHAAAAVKIVALGDYTNDARHFAQGKPIELIQGDQLIATVRSLQTTKARATHPLNTPLAFVGSMVAGLLLIAGLSPSTASPSQAQPFVAPTTFTQPAMSPPPQLASQYAAPTTPRAQPVIYASDARTSAEQREWKRKNAESMKILEKTTKEMPLR